MIIHTNVIDVKVGGSFVEFPGSIIHCDDYYNLVNSEPFKDFVNDPEILAWLMPKPRPSHVALTLAYLTKKTSKIVFDSNEYYKLIPNEDQRDIDSAFVRRVNHGALFETGAIEWDSHFAEIKANSSVGNIKRAYVTFYSGRYILGLMGLIRSLRRFTNDKIIILHTEDEEKFPLSSESNVELIKIDSVPNPNNHGQQRFRDTYNKLRIFDLLEYDKLIYIDSDCIILKDITELFSIKEEFAAAPDWGLKYGEGFNSGLIVFTPSESLQDLIWSNFKKGVFSSDGGDQGFLNEVLKDRYILLHPKYNTLKRIFDKKSCIFSLENISVLHFVGVKPWEILDLDLPYERLNNVWLSVLEKEDLILLHKFNKVYASRRVKKLKEGINKKTNDVEDKTINGVVNNAALKKKPKSKIKFSSILKFLGLKK